MIKNVALYASAFLLIISILIYVFHVPRKLVSSSLGSTTYIAISRISPGSFDDQICFADIPDTIPQMVKELDVVLSDRAIPVGSDKTKDYLVEIAFILVPSSYQVATLKEAYNLLEPPANSFHCGSLMTRKEDVIIEQGSISIYPTECSFGSHDMPYRILNCDTLRKEVEALFEDG